MLVLKLLPLVVLRYRGHADGCGGPGSKRLKNLSRGGTRGQPAGLGGDMLLRCAAVPDDRPGKQGPWVSRQRPLFLLLVSSPPGGSSNILFLGRRRSMGAPVVALARQVTSHAALVPWAVVSPM